MGAPSSTKIANIRRNFGKIVNLSDVHNRKKNKTTVDNHVRHHDCHTHSTYIGKAKWGVAVFKCNICQESHIGN